MTQAPRPTSPGRPKDLEKRAAILEAAKALFVEHGYDGTSMDAIAQRAGVSKLTVYSHFQDKDSLFVEAVKAKCEEQLPPDLFSVDLSGPLRAQLLKIARAFFALMTSDEAIGIQRVLARQVGCDSKLPKLFWEAGPRRTQLALAEFLRAEVEAGQLAIDDVERAASQFLCLLKGERHARLMCGCQEALPVREAEAHVEATVELFLRAYQPRP